LNDRGSQALEAARSDPAYPQRELARQILSEVRQPLLPNSTLIKAELITAVRTSRSSRKSARPRYHHRHRAARWSNLLLANQPDPVPSISKVLCWMKPTACWIWALNRST